MSYDYTGITASATGLIQKFGKSYTFTRTTDGGYNPATGTAGVVTSNFTKSACVFDNIATGLSGGDDYFDNAVLAGDRRVLAESGDYRIGDKIDIGGEIYQVIKVVKIAPGGDVVAANLQVRK